MLYSLQVFNRLQKAMICLSPSATIRLLDSLGADYDDPVTEWRDALVPRVEQTLQLKVHNISILMNTISISPPFMHSCAFIKMYIAPIIYIIIYIGGCCTCKTGAKCLCKYQSQ